ncbi:hypothetical protein [Streptomyces sp. A012304]|uniref:hypothetical protein n=1 Tax=Streptomyces sp. A012304 TaxID=375446 RepID=UPI0028525CC7|nr:hypothetical protein [Streptomyces sp. A012304]
MLITAGFVLAAGGLSLAELGVDAPGFPSSSNPAAAGGESSELDGSSAEPSASGRPLDDRTDTGGDKTSPSPDASASASASPSASASKSPGDEEATQTPEREAQSATRPGSAGSTPPDSDSTPTAAPTPTDEPSQPQPSPSETCTRFLWWCA